MARKERPVAPILVGAEEEHLHAGVRALAVQREYVGLGEGRRVDPLARVDLAHGADAVAQLGGALEIQPLGGLAHLACKLLLDDAALPREEGLRLRHQASIGLFVDSAGARRAAAFDLIQQTGPRASLE